MSRGRLIGGEISSECLRVLHHSICPLTGQQPVLGLSFKPLQSYLGFSSPHLLHHCSYSYLFKQIYIIRWVSVKGLQTWCYIQQGLTDNAFFVLLSDIVDLVPPLHTNRFRCSEVLKYQDHVLDILSGGLKFQYD